jgi:archaellum biogenesis ATPase FlaH
MHEALDMFLMSITDKASGKVKNFYKTGFTKFDEVIALRPRMTMTIIGTEGCGKSKFARTLAKGLLKNNSELALLIISGEESFDEVISDMISEKVKLSKREIGGVNYTLSDEDIQTIKKSTDGLKMHNIEIYDRSLNVIKLKNLVKKFVKKHGTQYVIIVDNLGCIDSSMKFTGETEKDNYVSGTIRRLRDETNGCFIVIHHLTKEADSDKRLKEAYRPRKDLARGSKKIIDDSNVALLVNFPSIYPDLLREEKNKWKKTAEVEDLELTEENYNEYLWKLNPAGDKDTSSFDPKTSGWRIAQDVCDTKRTMDGNYIKLGFLRMKYQEYVDYYKRVMEARDEKYRKEKLSIYSFLIKGMYNWSFSQDKTDRDNYLYGNSDQNNGIIEKLFIVDPAKVRDGGKGEIMRFLADLKFSKFKEWNV